MSNIGNKGIFSENLNYYISSKHLDKRNIADDLGIGYSTFYSWCSGTCYPRIDKIEALADYLNIDKMDLIEEHDQKYKDQKTAENLLNDEDKRVIAYEISSMDKEQLAKLRKLIEIMK